MKILTSELTGIALDWAVAQIEKPELDDEILASTGEMVERVYGDSDDYMLQPYSPSEDWAQGGPIIEREKISVTSQTNGHSWAARGAHNYSYGDTPLIAAMRCYVTSRLGFLVDDQEDSA